MSSVIVFETHSISEDNERGLATGWLPGRLSAKGREAACELGGRRRDDGLSAVFTSDLGRAVETAELAFGSTGLPILHDWRLRECDYGDLNGGRREDVHADRRRWLDTAYPGGESWRQAVHRAAGFLLDVPTRWDDKKIIIIGHVATKWALDHMLRGVGLEVLIAEEFVWQEGWQYQLGSTAYLGRYGAPVSRRDRLWVTGGDRDCLRGIAREQHEQSSPAWPLGASGVWREELFGRRWRTHCDNVGVSVRIETARLVIRDLRHGDLVGMNATWGDERVARFMGDFGPRTRDEVAEWLHRTIAVEQQEPRGSMNLTVAKRSDGAVVGWIGMGRDDRGVADWDFGYATHPDHRGQGYATEALAATLEYCVTTLGLSLWAQCDIANRASAHVMLEAGMTEITSPTPEYRRFRVKPVSR